MHNLFTIDHRPSADGAVFHVLSPQGTVIWRTPDHNEAIAERDRLNEALANVVISEVPA